MTCKISGPYHPVGDVEYVCLTHGDVCVEWDVPDEEKQRRHATGDSPRKSEFRCPVADPHPGDPPLTYESRS